MTNPFSEQYSKISDSKLLEVLNSEDDYNSLAIEAANVELRKRKLTSRQIQEAQEIIKIKQSSELNKEKKISFFLSKTGRYINIIHYILIPFALIMIIDRLFFSSSDINHSAFRDAIPIVIFLVLLFLKYLTKKK